MLIDTCAWIDLFDGTEKGQKVKEIIEKTECYTSAISLAELSYLIEKRGLDREKYLNAVNLFSTVIDLDRQLLEISGIIKAKKTESKKEFGLIDAIILATAKQYGLQILTGDRHFEGENALLL